MKKKKKKTESLDFMSICDSSGCTIRPKQEGIVVYVHPLGRYHVREFRCASGASYREAYAGMP